MSDQDDNVEISTLAAAIEKIDSEEFTFAINDVQQHLYGKKANEHVWVGEKLLKVVQHINSSGFLTNTSNKFTLNPK